MSNLGIVGSPTPLKDGHEKITGAMQFLPDIKLAGMLYASFVTSIYPHALIKGIETHKALASSGVRAVLTANDLPYVEPDKRFSFLLARDRVIFVGHPVAIVVANSEAAAIDGVGLVSVDYEELPAAVTMDQAMAQDAPLVWPDGVPGASDDASAHGATTDSNNSESNGQSNLAARKLFQRGDVDKGLAQSDIVVQHNYETQGVHQGYLETHGMIAEPHRARTGIKIWTSTQGIFEVRDRVADLLDIPGADVHVKGTPIGGGFGGKFPIYEGLIALVALRLGNPVRLVLTRREDMLCTNPMLPTRTHLILGAQSDGILTAMKGKVEFDSGCLPSGLGPFMAEQIGNNYRVPNLELEAKEILTFKPSCGAYRAPGAPQASFVIETSLDEIADKLGIDPVEIRRRNAVQTGDQMTNGNQWPQMGMLDVLDALESHPAWKARDSARVKGHGIGIAIGSWSGAAGPSAASCTLGRDGNLDVHVGAVDATGTSTPFALLAAETFGVSAESVRVIVGDSKTAPFSGATGGSKITYSVGPAVLQAAQDAREQTLAIAAEEFEVDSNDLYISQGNVCVRGVPNRKIALSEIATMTLSFDGKHPPVFGQGRHANTARAPVFSAQIAEVEVDQETGNTAVLRLAIIQDVGRAINPLIVRGQIMGGATQGLGWALYENLHYDTYGQLLAASWLDYVIPHAQHTAETLEIVLVEVPSEHGPFGARGVGEPPIVATAAAVANAINDATGIRPNALPIRPSQLLSALKDAQNLG